MGSRHRSARRVVFLHGAGGGGWRWAACSAPAAGPCPSHSAPTLVLASGRDTDVPPQTGRALAAGMDADFVLVGALPTWARCWGAPPPGLRAWLALVLARGG